MHIHVTMNEYVKFTHILMYIQVDASSSWRFSHYTFIYLWHDGCVFLLQCVAVRCSALQCVAVRCSALKCLALYCNSHYTFIYLWHDGCVVLQWAASVLQCVAVSCKRVAVCCNGVFILPSSTYGKMGAFLLQCVQIFCIALQCV